MNKLIHSIVLFASVSFIITWQLLPLTSEHKPPSHHTDSGFKNIYPGYQDKDFGDFLFWILIDRARNGRTKGPDDVNLPCVENDGSFLKEKHKYPTFTWVGHSTFLIQVDGINILTDPVWSDRASPLSFVGPKRYVKPGLEFSQLPDIDIVMISHDHYDHLDTNTILKLGNKPLYMVPLGVEKILSDLDITNVSIHDWWEAIEYNNIRVTAVPAQHFSGRTMFDRNTSLWCGWVITTSKSVIYFAGDTGYFPGFTEIKDKFGKIDIAMLPIGAYKPRWFMGPVHLDPADAIKAYLDLKADIFVAIHWGTFPLADEEMDEPPKLLFHELDKLGLEHKNFNVFSHGETRTLQTSPSKKR
ncbi:MAG TPA: MBL fold metallo-hydrolase [Spirochaetota bacterium]|nr:MBL fold metallo-hydrolase [Spirochaetota bacterium]